MNRLKEIRISKGMTQTDIAEMLNVRQATVSLWESGISMPRADMLIKLAKLLNCTIDDSKWRF